MVGEIISESSNFQKVRKIEVTEPVVTAIRFSLSYISYGHDAVARARVTDQGLFDTFSGHFLLSVFLDQWGLPQDLRVEPQCWRGFFQGFYLVTLLIKAG